MSETGRLSIPAKQRKELGLEEGGMVVARVENGELRIRPVRTVLRELQAKVSGLLGPAAESLAGLALALVLVMFMLLKREDLRNRLIRLVGYGQLSQLQDSPYRGLPADEFIDALVDLLTRAQVTPPLREH